MKNLVALAPVLGTISCPASSFFFLVDRKKLFQIILICKSKQKPERQEKTEQDKEGSLTV